MKKVASKKSRKLGKFALPDGSEVFGELRLKGRNSTLKLRLEGTNHQPKIPRLIHGQLHDLSKVSCIQCICTFWGNSGAMDEERYCHADVFPHFVTIGSQHLQPDQPSIKAVHFTVTDISSIFYDFDAFGHVIDSKPLIENVVKSNNIDREIAVGGMPLITYFTGKREIISVDTVIGRISVNHCPSYNMGGPNGVFIKNKIMVTVTPVTPVAFDDCIELTMTVVRFLTLLAGRKQGVKSVCLDIADESVQPHAPLHLSWSFAPQGYKKNDKSVEVPHPGDIPLDAVHRPEEFATALKDWVVRDSTWRIARARYNECLRQGNSYDTNRLIAAANMFDLLPKEAVPIAPEMSTELVAAQTQCRTIFKSLRGIERDSIMNALGRMGKPSLTTKVLHRGDIVARHLGHKFPELTLVLKTSVKCRNYFVHGGSDNFNYAAIEPLMSFLTDALEFTFAASDLIEAGWDANS
ncbi:MAG: hypothetical protein PHP85_10440 [Gallionella sp.]|nr:hypothetical protein [Gallionella sp.]